MAEKLVPNYIFESSWEVCNKVGGIYTVLSTLTPQQLAVIVATIDGNRLKRVSGLGKKKA